jgi:hypothetical protein
VVVVVVVTVDVDADEDMDVALDVDKTEKRETRDRDRWERQPWRGRTYLAETTGFADVQIYRYAARQTATGGRRTIEEKESFAVRDERGRAVGE